MFPSISVSSTPGYDCRNVRIRFDTIGLKTVLAKRKEYQAKLGDDFKPAALLEKLAAEGGTFTKS